MHRRHSPAPGPPWLPSRSDHRRIVPLVLPSLDAERPSQYRSHNGYRKGHLVKFLSTRMLRNQPGAVRKLAQEDDLVLTANGKPVAILVAVDEQEFEETAQAIRRARAQMAVSRMRRESARRGLERLSESAIEAEIRAVRSRRKPG